MPSILSDLHHRWCKPAEVKRLFLYAPQHLNKTTFVQSILSIGDWFSHLSQPWNKTNWCQHFGWVNCFIISDLKPCSPAIWESSDSEVNRERGGIWELDWISSRWLGVNIEEGKKTLLGRASKHTDVWEIARAGLAYLYCIITGCPNLCDYQRWKRVKRRGEFGGIQSVLALPGQQA